MSTPPLHPDRRTFAESPLCVSGAGRNAQRFVPRDRRSRIGNAYALYAARSMSNAHLPGLLAPVHIMNGFFRMCRESGLWVMHNETYIRIKAEDGGKWWPLRRVVGGCGYYMGYYPSNCHLQLT